MPKAMRAWCTWCTWVVSCLSLVSAAPIVAATLESSNYRHTGGIASASAAGNGALQSQALQPTIGSLDATVGGSPTAAPAGSTTTLVSVLPGLWPIVRGALPTLDLDGDLVQFFLDDDDDGDGLLDEYETATGFFLSPTNTGSSPVDADTDGDGYADGVEVAAASDPNNPTSTPAPGVPLLGLAGWTLLVVALTLIGLVFSHRNAAGRSLACSPTE